MKTAVNRSESGETCWPICERPPADTLPAEQGILAALLRRRYSANRALKTRCLPVAAEEVHVMLFEPASVVNTGDTASDMTLEKLDRI